MKIDAAPVRPRRRMNLTPMIDVVFLLLVFFMMVSRFGSEQGVGLLLAAPQGGAVWSGPPRLIELRAGGALALNGLQIAPDGLIAALTPLMATPQDPVVLRTAPGSAVQDLLAVMDRLNAAGITRIVVLP